MVSRGPKVSPMTTVQWRGRDLEWNSNSGEIKAPEGVDGTAWDGEGQELRYAS